MMFVSVIIDNYNYGRFLRTAIDSVLEQSYANLELIVVDDGSTDNSRSVIRNICGSDKRATYSFKDNGGQLSGINNGIRLAKGDAVFLLDADDYFESDYIEKAIQVYTDYPGCDFLFCGIEHFGASDRTILRYPESPITDLGFTAYLTFCRNYGVGEMTSALSFRRELADKVFPIPLEDSRKIRPDVCIVNISSLLLARKYYLAEPLVRYRIHESNANALMNSDIRYLHKVYDTEFLAYTRKRFRYFSHSLRHHNHARMLFIEAQTGDKPKSLLKIYAKAILYSNRSPLFYRVYYFLLLMISYMKQQKRAE